ncbi:MAG TPA: amylo-alpha-1,6-glucosidase [Ignavibacteriales bacterium]|nr:amylo-alpha-1,6-glucosidase [Ignavibacteriales bacterium]
MRNLLFLFAGAIFLCGCSAADKKSGKIDEIMIEVQNNSREFSYTHKKYGQYYGLTNSYFNDGWMGWTYKERRIFNDYEIYLDGNLLDRKSAVVQVYPHQLIRKMNGTEETVFFADSLDLIVIKLQGAQDKKITMNFPGIVTAKPAIENKAFVFPLDEIKLAEKLYVYSNAEISLDHNPDSTTVSFHSDKDDLIIHFYISQSAPNIPEQLAKTDKYIEQKKTRLAKLIEESFVETNDEELNKALLWAKISLDALITKQDFKGLFAGLPWFNNYWGRDTFISLPGATFVQGNYAEAKEILLDFAKHQDRNPASPNYGRIPNRITLTETIYNTADGTPWFVIQAYNYFRYSGDKEFIKEIYPSLKLAFHAALKNRTDQYGFLTHGDADTWMDAVGPNGPWSPRGNRANDIQALWHKQLTSTADIANTLGDTLFAKLCSNYADRLAVNFYKEFVDTTNNIIYDRMDKNGKKDASLRPNLFFVLNEPPLIFSYKESLEILANGMNGLVYPYGVLSLSYNDENFHPYHNYPPYYVKDAAYHNGIIWQWNTGPVVQALCGFGMQDKAWTLTKELTDQILYQGAVGTLAELSEALPRRNSNEILMSGTFSQAWSLAEYIRNFYQDYLGVKPDAPNKTLYLLPTLPAEITNARFKQRIGTDEVYIKYNFNEEKCIIDINAESIADSLDIGASLINRSGANYQLKTSVHKGDILKIEIPARSNSLRDMRVIRNGSEISVSCQIYNDPPQNQALYEKVKFAKPELNPNLKSLQGPGYDLLANGDVKQENPNALTIFEVIDEEDSEIYEYPLSSSFSKGILNITGFKLSEDKENYYFELTYKNLTNPGWHKEFGYQLTFTAIAVKNNSSDDKISREVGLNSMYVLPAAKAYNRLISVGGGVEIRDGSGKVLASYIPASQDVKNPLGSAHEKKITFALPRKYLGGITRKSAVSLLVGAQDDHGGAGIGDFRSVEAVAGEWVGGGKKDPGAHNIYDFLFIN